MRLHHAFKLGFLTLILLVATPAAAYAQTVTCVAPVSVTPTAAPTISGGGDLTVLRFPFIGSVEHCLADGTRVPGAIAGSTLQLVNADGSGTVLVRETLTIPDGSTLGFIIHARFTPTSFEGSIFTTFGTGQLARVHGRGTFFPTAPPTGPVGPTEFLSTLVYEYV